MATGRHARYDGIFCGAAVRHGLGLATEAPLRLGAFLVSVNLI